MHEFSDVIDLAIHQHFDIVYGLPLQYENMILNSIIGLFQLNINLVFT